MGKIFEHEQKLDQAARTYQVAKRLNANRLEAYYALGFLYQRTKEYEKALAEFEGILKLPAPTDRRPYQASQTGHVTLSDMSCFAIDNRAFVKQFPIEHLLIESNYD